MSSGGQAVRASRNRDVFDRPCDIGYTGALTAARFGQKLLATTGSDTMMQIIGRIAAFGAMISTCLATGTACLAGSLSAEPWKAPSVERLPSQHPVVACTGDELARLQAAYRGRGPQHDLVAKVVTAATRSISRPIDFPPRGGQHNQWYQCDRCQISLKTLDASRHECPQCKTVYSGEPYDDVIFSKVHSRNLGDMEDAAWAYALTGDEKYAAFAAKVLLGFNCIATSRKQPQR